MNIAVLFDGGGLARLGLERAGHQCTGYELNPTAHHLSKHVGSGNCVLADVRDVDLSGYGGAWTSPPCQIRSSANTSSGLSTSAFSDNLLPWSLSLKEKFPNLKVLWVENVIVQGSRGNDWGRLYNAAQFLPVPVQNRNRIIGGTYPPPDVYHPYRKKFQDSYPCVTATEYNYSSGSGGKRRAGRYIGRKLDIDRCAYLQGFEIPPDWRIPLRDFTLKQWDVELYTAIGNGVPVYMAYAFGLAVAREIEEKQV